MTEKVRIKSASERVIVYIDGFNLYFRMNEAGYGKDKWLNLSYSSVASISSAFAVMP